MRNGEDMSSEAPRPVGVAMSDGTVRPFEEVLGGLNELAARRGLPKSTIASWWARRDRNVNPFPDVIFRPSTGPLFFLSDIDDYRPGVGRWGDSAA